MPLQLLRQRRVSCTCYTLLQDRIGIDVELLDEMQKSILGLYRNPATVSPSALGQANLDAIQESINGLCSASIQTALYKAAGQLLDDLHRNVRLLGTPERSVHCLPCQLSLYDFAELNVSALLLAEAAVSETDLRDHTACLDSITASALQICSCCCCCCYVEMYGSC